MARAGFVASLLLSQDSFVSPLHSSWERNGSLMGDITKGPQNPTEASELQSHHAHKTHVISIAARVHYGEVGAGVR